MQTNKRDIIIEKFAKVFANNDKCLYGWLRLADNLLRSNFKGTRARHYKAEDVVREIMVRVMEGKRKWDIDRVPDINTFMIMQIKSFIYDLSSTEKTYLMLDNYFFNEDEEGVETYDLRSCLKAPDDIEYEYEVKEKLKSCIDLFEENGDAECLKVMDLLMYEFKNREIAEELNIDIRKVENIKKRIRNKLNKHAN